MRLGTAVVLLAGALVVFSLGRRFWSESAVSIDCPTLRLSVLSYGARPLSPCSAGRNHWPLVTTPAAIRASSCQAGLPPSGMRCFSTAHEVRFSGASRTGCRPEGVWCCESSVASRRQPNRAVLTTVEGETNGSHDHHLRYVERPRTVARDLAGGSWSRSTGGAGHVCSGRAVLPACQERLRGLPTRRK